MKNLRFLLPILILCGCYDENDYIFTEHEINNLISCERTSTGPIFADGITPQLFKVQLKKDIIDRDKRTLVIKSTRGKIIEGTKDGTDTKIELNTDNSVIFTYMPNTDVGTTLISISVEGLNEIRSEVTFEQERPSLDSMIYFVQIPEIINADGESENIIEVKVNNKYPLGTKVTFLTNKGSFVDDNGQNVESIINNERKATASLRSSLSTGQTRLSAQVGNFQVTDYISHIIAEPDQIIMRSDADSITIDESVSLNIELIRTVGSVSQGTKLVFTSDQGSFENDIIIYGGTGKVTNTFRIGKTDFRGPLELFMDVGTKSKSKVTIHIVDP